MTVSLKSLFTLGAMALAAPLMQAATIEVQLENVETPEGQILIALFKGEGQWKASQGLVERAVAVTSDTVTIVFDDVPAGEYAIRLFHDVDSNGELKTGRFGIPTEPYGFSNNAPVRFGPPKYKTAAFTVEDAGAVQIITLK